MKSYLFKTAVFLIVLMIALSTSPVYADDTLTKEMDTKPRLSLDAAIDAAIDHSDILGLDEKEIDYRDEINDIKGKIDENPQLIGKVELEIPENKKELDEDIERAQLRQAEQKKDFDQDRIIQQTTTAYNNIVTSEMKMELAEKDIEIKSRELAISKLKMVKGIITEIDFNASELKLEDLKTKFKASENALSDAEYNFKDLTGKDIKNYTLDKDVQFDKFEIEGSVDSYIDDVIDEYLKYNTLIVKLNKNYFNDENNEVDDVKDADLPKTSKPETVNGDDLDAYEEYERKLDQYYQERENYAFKLSTRLAYLNARLGTYEGETNLKEIRKKYKEQLRAFYSELTNVEGNINLLKRNIKLSDAQLDIYKIKYETGMITKVDYDDQLLNNENLSIQLRDTINIYNTLKAQIEKPWTVFVK